MSKSEEHNSPAVSSRMHSVRQLGVVSWSIIGVIALVVIIAGGLSALSGILIPLVIAYILGTLLSPAVDGMRKRGVPTNLATVIGLFIALIVMSFILAIIVWGFLQQLPTIAEQLTQGWVRLLQFGRSLDVDSAVLERVRGEIATYAPYVAQGVLGTLTHTIFGIVSLSMGLFFSLFFLFFILRDAHAFPVWFARVTSLDEKLVTEVDALSSKAMRGYFKGTALTALITAPIFMLPLIFLKVPLILPIFILYFFLSFLPYVGAWLTGAFAILITLSSGGLGAASIVALSLLISNGTIQSAVSSWALGSSLKMHPVMVLLATMIGGTVAGMLGMILGPPLLSAVSRGFHAVQRRRTELELEAETVDNETDRK